MLVTRVLIVYVSTKDIGNWFRDPLYDTYDSATNKEKIRHILFSYLIISGIGIFGLISTTLLISANVNSSFLDIYASIIQHMSASTSNNTTKVSMIGSHWWLWNSYWIPMFSNNIDSMSLAKNKVSIPAKVVGRIIL